MTTSPIMRMLARWAARSYLGRPDQAEIIAIKYPRVRDLPAAFANELCFRLRSSSAFRLTALNVELTSRCNLACSICPRHAERGAGHSERGAGHSERGAGHLGGSRGEDLDFGTFRAIIDSTPHLRTLLPYQWGEPLLSPILCDAIAYASARGVRVMVTTNGTLMDDRKARSLIESGLERLTFSFDGSASTHQAIRGTDGQDAISRVALFKEVRDSAESRCKLDVSMVVDEATEPHMAEFARTFEGLADRIQYVPRFINASRSAACREPWRGQLVVLANGDVTVCCVDSEGLGVLGNVRDRMPSQWFNSPEMRAFRKKHIDRTLPELCANCGEYAGRSVSARF